MSGLASVNTDKSTYDTVLAVYRGRLGSLISVKCDKDNGVGFQSQLDFAAHPGETYYIEVAGYTSIHFIWR